MIDNIRSHIDKLLESLGETPKWNGIKIIEESMIIRDRIPYVCSSEPISVKEYASRFETLLDSGFAWINLHAAGILGGDLLITIELPSNSSGAPRNRVSVNLSGPEHQISEIPGWKLDWQIKGNA